MIDEKKIEEFIKHYCKETGAKEKNEVELLTGGIKEGAYTAIKWFLKDLWHDASEEPKDHTDIVYIDEKGSVWSEFDYYADNYDDAFHTGWLSFVNNGVLRVIKWCYLSDILPKEGGEK